MKVFADLHHGDLFYSLQLLFEKRFRFELYRPIGLDWYTEGYWHVFPHPDTAKQYLALDQATNIPRDIHGNELPTSARLNSSFRYEDGIYYVADPTKDNVQRAITLDKFKSMDFDIVISSIPQHIKPFNDLIARHQPRAKHIFQVGNAWGNPGGVKNILSSTEFFPTPSDINVVFYHQEFDLDMYQYEPPENRNIIYSYIHYMPSKNQMNQLQARLPGWTFRSFGAGMEDSIMKTADIGRKIRESAFTFHVKPGGDGFGHTIHGTYACGRPAITDGRHYRGKLANRLFEHKVTCLDYTAGEDLVGLLNYYSQPEEHNKMCAASYKRFKDCVNYDQEESQIRKFIENLR